MAARAGVETPEPVQNGHVVVHVAGLAESGHVTVHVAGLAESGWWGLPRGA